jgi:hypothetical protein
VSSQNFFPLIMDRIQANPQNIFLGRHRNGKWS